MITNPQELISTLKAQHRVLQSDLQFDPSLNSRDIILNLNKFKTDLLAHLSLENGEFYPDYKAKKEKNGEDPNAINEFINIMAAIGKEVMEFLNKYNTPETIDNSNGEFSNELTQITNTLNTRIETEEEGVYDIYLLS
jgi:regulator of sigma D